MNSNKELVESLGSQLRRATLILGLLFIAFVVAVSAKYAVFFFMKISQVIDGSGFDSNSLYDALMFVLTAIAAVGGAIAGLPIVRSLHDEFRPKVYCIFRRAPFDRDYGKTLSMLELTNKRSHSLTIREAFLYREVADERKLIQKLPINKTLILHAHQPLEINFGAGEVLLSTGIDGDKCSEWLSLQVALIVEGYKKPILATLPKEPSPTLENCDHVADHRLNLTNYSRMDAFPKDAPRMPLNSKFLFIFLDNETNYVLYINFSGSVGVTELRGLLKLPMTNNADQLSRFTAQAFLEQNGLFSDHIYRDGRWIKHYLLLNILENQKPVNPSVLREIGNKYNGETKDGLLLAISRAT